MILILLANYSIILSFKKIFTQSRKNQRVRKMKRKIRKRREMISKSTLNHQELQDWLKEEVNLMSRMNPCHHLTVRMSRKKINHPANQMTSLLKRCQLEVQLNLRRKLLSRNRKNPKKLTADQARE